MTSRRVVKVNFLIFIMIFSVVSPVLMVQKEPSSLSKKSNPSFVNQAGDVDFDWWEIEHSTNDIAHHISSIVDTNDFVHIAYYHTVNHEIKYATNVNGVWVNQTVADSSDTTSGALIGGENSIQIDSSGRIHIIFLEDDTSECLYHAYNQSTAWIVSQVTCNGGRANSIAIDSNDNLHVSHWDQGVPNLEYSVYDGLSWTTTTLLNGGVEAKTSIAVDSNDNIHISYIASTSSPSGSNVGYIVGYSSGGWDYAVVGDVYANELVIDVNSSDVPSIAIGTGAGDLYLLTSNISSPTPWQDFDSLLLDTNTGLAKASLNFDSDDNALVLYYKNNAVTLIIEDEGVWQSPEALPFPSGGDVGRTIASDLDTEDMLRISYQGNLANRAGFGLHHARLLPDLRIDSISPNSAELGDTVPVTITGDGFDMLPKYIKPIDITNDFNYPVQDYSIFVENPTYDETDLVASYHFEDDDLVGVKDTSGNELDGTINGNPTHGEGVNGGNSLDLDGNDYVSIPGDEFKDLGSEDFTIMMWVRRDISASSTSYEGIMTNNPASGDGFVISMPGYGTNNPNTYAFYTVNSGYIASSLGRDIDVWHHLAFTYDSNSNFLQIYTDGSADGSGTVTIPSSTADLHLGHFYTPGTTGPWNGAIDDVKIYSRALSSFEIASYVNADIRYDYGDIRFIDSDGTSLDYQMLSDGNFMINIPSMSALETRTIHITYGAFGLESQSQELDEYQFSGELGMGFIDEAIGYWPLDDLGVMEWSGTSITLDNIGSFAGNNSIAIDSNDNIHVAYHDSSTSDLKYISFDGANWSAPLLIDSAGGEHNSIALDSNDSVYISYHDANNNRLKIATNSEDPVTTDYHFGTTTGLGGYAGSFTIVAGEVGRIVYMCGSLVQNYCNESGVAIGDQSNGAVYDMGRNDVRGAGFQSVIGQQCSGDSGFSGIVYSDTFSGSCNTIGVLGPGNYELYHYDYYGDGSNGGSVMLQTVPLPQGFDWKTTTIDSTTTVDYATSMHIDSSDVAHISYYDDSNGDLMYTYYDGAIQTPVRIATTGDVGKYSSLDIDSNDNIYISFSDYTTGELSLIKKEQGVGWGSIVQLDGNAAISSHTGGDIREEISLAIDVYDGIHIVYFDWSNGDLRYINSSDGIYWDLPQTITSNGIVGSRNSIAINSLNEVHIMYYSESGGGILGHAYKQNNVWNTDNSIFNGIYNSIAFDSEDNMHLSYFYDNGNSLNYHFVQPTRLGSLADASTNGNNANVISNLESVPAVFDSGVKFDGMGDYIEINNPPDWYSGIEFTWALWIKLNDVNSNQMFIKHGTASGGSGNGAYLNYYQNKIMFTSPTGQTAQGVMSPQLDQITDISGWNHIALTVDTSGTTNLYVNGVDVSLSAYGGSLTGISAPTGSMTIGYDGQNSNQRFHGMMDDIIILERALESSEISSYYNNSIVSRMFYDFDAHPMNTCPGGTISDYNMAHDATVHGLPVCSSGYHDESLHFDGINDYLQISSGSWQNSSTASVGYHVNLTGFTHTGGEVVGFASDESYNNGIRAGISLGITANGNVECQVGDSVSTTAPSIVTTNLSLTTGVWYHLLCSWDNSTLRLYVDGLLSHTHTPTPGTFNGMSWGPGFSGPGPALLGKYSTHFTGSNTMYTAYSNALYDNFAYFDYALPDDVVQELFGQSIIWPTTINNHGVLGSSAHYDYDLLLINGTSDYDSLNNFVIVNETTITATIPSNLNLAGSGFYDILLNGDGDVEICRLVDGFEFIITDADGDGWADDVDAFPNDSTQWQDSDGDGYGDNLAGNNSDAFPYDATQWQDSDGDGYGDNLTGSNPDIFPSEPSQWNDTDGDGYGDNQSGFEPDDCVQVWGNSTNGRFGCPDDDGDGLANIDDAFPDDPLRGGDTDLDGYDDGLDDDCPSIWGNSTIDRIGCVDTDGDGYSDGDLNWTVVNGSDAFPLEVSQWLDSDGDGYGDNSTGFEGDQCPQVWGNSTIGQLGCPDNDGDGLSNTEDDCPDSNNSIGSTDSDGDGCLDSEDAFPDDSTEHEDSDGDGIGDNSDPEPGVPLDSDGDGYPDRPGYADSDDCPQISGNSTGELVGCLDTDGDGLADTIDAFPNDGTRTTDTDLDGYDDLIEDDCVDEWGNSTIDLLGCLDSDGDGVSDINDLFPDDSTDWNDDDGDGVGNNSDVFPQDANETIDSDGDGVGDNADLFPQDANETVDSDGDGIGDNEDQYPLQDNFIDTDNDGIFDVEDAFVTDPTQWQDADNDGYGDNLTGLLADLFPTDETQWFDLDGDGYGDNWGNETWNSTRLLIWPGMYIENASLADHCPDTWGNSTADGYFGCPDLDGDSIADIYDDEIDLGEENNQTQQITDTDNDGVTDLFDFCPNSLPGEIVDAEGCLVDQDGDGVGDSVDKCPNTPTDVEVNVEGCAISNDDESDTIIDELLAGDTDAIVRTVGIGAIIIAVIGFMQTNFIAAMLPDAFRWVQVFRKKSKLSAEEEMELGHLQSVVQAYFNDVDELKEELFNLKSDLTARFTNGEIKADTRKLIFTLIGDLQTMESAELKRIADDDRFFGLAGTTDTKERLEMLEIEKAMRSFDDDSIDEETESFGSDFLDKNSPSPETKGIINEDDGHEYIEHPADSGRWFIRNTRTNMWDEWKD